MTNKASSMPASVEIFPATPVGTGTPVEHMPTVAEIFRPPTPVLWPTTRSVINVAIELLPTIEDDLLADLIEPLVVAIVEREDELKGVSAVLSAALALTFTQHNEIVRLQKQLRALRDERRTANGNRFANSNANDNGNDKDRTEEAYREEEIRKGKERTTLTTRPTTRPTPRTTATARQGQPAVQLQRQGFNDMNMDEFMPHWINAAELQRLGGRYEGIVARVVAERVHNRYKKEGDQIAEPVIEFTDGYRLVPNIAMRRRLIEQFGAETDAWTGARLVLVCRRGKDHTDKQTGEVRETWTKHLEFPDGAAPTWTTDTDAADDSDEMGAHDEVDVEVRSIARRRG